MNRRALVLVICAFLLTRGFLLWQTGTPLYESASNPDIPTYERWAEETTSLGQDAYRDVDIEYPPGALPVILAPSVSGDYRTAFIFLMFFVDVAGLVALLVMARRTGTFTGASAWIGGALLLGPIAYLRLDMVPAVITIWALEATQRGSWKRAGWWWILAVFTKLYALVLLPAALLRSKQPKALLVGVAGAGATFLILVAFNHPLDMLHDVFGYHAGRGLQLESTWATALQAAGHLGHDVDLRVAGGAIEVTSAWASTLKVVGLACSVLTVAWGTLAIKRADARDLNAGLYGLLALVLGVGTVLSPQFLLWLIALAAAALCFPHDRFRTALLAVLPLAFLTQLVYPSMYEGLKDGDLFPLLVLGLRNLGLIAVGGWVLLSLRRRPAHTPTPPN